MLHPGPYPDLADRGDPSMSTTEPPSSPSQRLQRAAQIIVVSSVMFSFISYWRTAAVVLCDMSSTAYYIGGIVELSIGKAAPWFILGVLVFSYAVRLVYVESCSLFVRGGVYRVVKTAMGPFLGKLAVSALMFDYILTGPISGVSAGQYVVGLILETIAQLTGHPVANGEAWKATGSVIVAILVTLYFYWQNLLGIHESSDKALKIMIATTIMAVIMLSWCVFTLAYQGPKNSSVPWQPNLEKKWEEPTEGMRDEGGGMKKDKDLSSLIPQGKPRMNTVTGEQEDPLGFLPRILPESLTDTLRHPPGWLSLIGLIGIFIAFGHSILAMSGEETLAQVYREVESPKLPNFQKAAFIVFLYSLLLTGSISFLAVVLIPDDVRMAKYSDNLIGGLAMNVVGPPWARLLLNALVVVVGAFILSGAVNTAIIGSNGVLNRVAEDGVLPDWFLKPHPRYGTTYRVLTLIVVLQLFTILVTWGNVYLLGEAYAFGVVWSFVFQSLSMLVLRFKDPRPREYRVPLNLKIGGIELPIGLGLVFLILALTAVLNFFTKEVATVGGAVFTLVFMIIFSLSERYHHKRRQGQQHEHIEQFNRQVTAAATREGLQLHRPFRKLVAIRSPYNLYMLEKALNEADPQTTDVVVMTAKLEPPGGADDAPPGLDPYDQQLMTAVVQKAEQAGKEVRPLIVPTNNPLHAVLKTAMDIGAQEVIVGASNKYTADEQMEQIAFFWISLHGGEPAPVTVRILSRDRDMYYDLGGGNRIPRISERRARSVAELRAAGVGVDRVLLLHDGTSAGSDLFQAVLTMLDPLVDLGVMLLSTAGNGQDRAASLSGRSPQERGGATPGGLEIIQRDEERASRLGRPLRHLPTVEDGEGIVRVAREEQFDLIIVPLPPETPGEPLRGLEPRLLHVVHHAHCRVFVAAQPAIPQEVVDQGPARPAPAPGERTGTTPTGGAGAGTHTAASHHP